MSEAKRALAQRNIDDALERHAAYWAERDRLASASLVDRIMTMPIADLIRLDIYLDEVAAGRPTGLCELVMQHVVGVSPEKIRWAQMRDRRARAYQRVA